MTGSRHQLPGQHYPGQHHPRQYQEHTTNNNSVSGPIATTTATTAPMGQHAPQGTTLAPLSSSLSLSASTIPAPDFTTRLIKVTTSVWRFIIYPFFLALYESLALWRVFTHVKRSQPLKKWIRNCLVLNGVVFLGSLLFYSFIVEPALHWVLTFHNAHRCVSWWGEVISSSEWADSGTYLTCEHGGFATTETIFAGIFHLCWTIPIYLISLVANGVWHNKISEEVFKLQSVLLADNGRGEGGLGISGHTHHTHHTQATPHHYTHPLPPQPPPQSVSLESSLSPMRAFSLITEQISRIVIFLLLLVQATVLSLITLPPIFSQSIVAKIPPLSVLNTLIQYTPLMLSYGLTSISYTYAMFEFTWSSPQLTQLHKSALFDPTQIAIINQLQALRGEHDMSQLNCRFKYVEYRMAYFLGFSILLTIVTFPLPFLTSISLFGLVFPLNLLTSLVSSGHMDLLDAPLFPQAEIGTTTATTTTTTTTTAHGGQPHSTTSKTSSRRVVIPPNTSSQDALSIIYTAHDLSVPYQLPIFDVARWLNDNLFVFITKRFQRGKNERTS